jgi:hypothetical protein
MKLLLAELKPKDQTSDKGKQIVNEINMELEEIRGIMKKGFNNNNALTMVNNYTRYNQELYTNLYSRINSILWDKGYLMNETYGVTIKEDPTEI